MDFTQHFYLSIQFLDTFYTLALLQHMFSLTFTFDVFVSQLSAGDVRKAVESTLRFRDDKISVLETLQKMKQVKKISRPLLKA